MAALTAARPNQKNVPTRWRMKLLTMLTSLDVRGPENATTVTRHALGIGEERREDSGHVIGAEGAAVVGESR